MMTMMKHSTIRVASMPGATATRGAARAPPIPASAEPAANTNVYTRGTLTPRADSISRSWAAAFISRPQGLRSTSSHSIPATAGPAAAHEEQVRRVAGDAEIDGPVQSGRIRHAVLIGAPDHLGGVAGEQHQGEGEQQLHQRLSPVQVAKQQAFDRSGQQGQQRGRGGDADPESPRGRGGLRDNGVAGVGADHEEGAVGEVDDPQYAEDQRQSRGDDEQVHPQGQGVEELDQQEGGGSRASRQLCAQSPWM